VDALRLLPERDLAMRGFVVALQSTIYRWSGDLVAAARVSAQAVSLCRAARDSRVTMEALTVHAAQQYTRGQVREAYATCQEALQLADKSTRQWGKAPPIVASVHRLASRILYEWNDLQGALRFVRQGIELSLEWGGVEGTAFAYMGLAKVLQAMGDPQGSLDAIQEGKQQAGIYSSWFGGYGAAQQARLRLTQGDLAAAARWALESGLGPDDEPGFQYLLEYRVLARVLLAQGEPDRALKLLDKLLDVAEGAGAGLPAIECLLLQALAWQAKGSREQALAVLVRALALAEPEGLVRTFVDEGPPMGALLRQAARAGIAVDYARRLLSALEGGAHGDEQAASPEPLRRSPLEPLSDREREVLRLLATHLSAPQIADELVVSRHTVRTHVKHIYDKLGVHSRAEAVQRAQELALI
jgi:LuxR family maltose regulon positive regulatory protein